MNSSQYSTGFTPLSYDDREFGSMVENQILNDHKGLHDVLGVLINTVAKRRNDDSLHCEEPYSPRAGPITFAEGAFKFLKWWNNARTSHLDTLYHYRRLSKDIDRRILSSRSIKHLSKMRDYNDIEAWLVELNTRNKDFMFWTIFSWTHMKRLTL